MKFVKKHIKAVVFVILYFSFLLWYAKLPEYKVCNSISTSSRNYRETTLMVVAYKAKYNPFLYAEIEEEHNLINGTPNKLTILLYHTQSGKRKGKKPFRTIIYDYDNHISYIKLDYLD